MTDREYQIATIKIQNIIRKGELARAIEAIRSLISRVEISGSVEMRKHNPTLSIYVNQLSAKS